MAVISVEVPDTMVKHIKPFSVVDLDTLEDMMYTTVVDFWAKWASKKQLEEYFSENK